YMVSSEKNRFQKILEDANIKLSVVLSDVFGKTGMKMIRKIVYGDNYRPEELLCLVHGRVKAKREDIKEALTGYVTDHHRLMLRTILDNMDRIQTTIAELDAAIEKAIEPLGAEI